MTITFVLGTLEYISANFINPYTGEILEIEGEYYVNDTVVDGGSGTSDIILGSTHNQFFTLEDPSGNVLLQDLEVFLMAAGHDILMLSSDTVELGNTEIQMAEGNDIVWANVGDDLIGGSSGDDILNGGPGNDTLNGDEDNDTLIGWTGNDTLNGGTGQDTLEGGADDDVYMFAPGDGTDIITETSGMDMLVFTDGIILTDLTFNQVGNDLQIDLDVSGVLSSVTITGFYSGDPNLTVELAEFDDGSSFDLLSLLAPPDLGEPDAVNDAISNDVSVGDVSGNVMDNDVASPDGDTTVVDVTFDGTVVSVPTDGSDITVTGANGTLTINNTGAYTYSPFAIGPTVASVFDQFTYTLSDFDGDLDSATLDITTVNDSYDLGEPDAVDDAVTFNFSDTSTTGNVIGNDVVSPDGPTLLVDVTFGATTVVLPTDGSDITIAGTNGILTINNTGAYSYEPFAMTPAITSVVDVFEYSLGDVDGDLDVASLEITTINDSDDVIMGTAGDDVLFGGAGDDTIDGGAGSDHLMGGDGDDLLIYSNDAVWPGGFVAWNVGAPDAIIDGDKVTVAPRYRSYDNFDGGDGVDTIQMGDDSEALFLDDRYSGNPTGYNTARIVDVEIIRAGDGNDIVDMTSKQFTYGDVSIYGDGGNDVLWGNAGNDYIEGGTGNDHLDGASGNDTLFGGAGNDRMYGQSGDDTFIVGEGNDKIYTGSGADTIIYDVLDTMSDHIYDFSAVDGDRLDLSDILQGYDALTDAINDFVSVTQQGANTIVSVDADGGGDNFVQIAKLHGVCGLGDAESLETSGILITV